MLNLSGFAISAFAFGGALLTALAIYLLAWKQGVAGYRLVLVGIGIAAMLGARRRALSGFITTEAAILLVAGVGSGLFLGGLLYQTLAKVLTGVFDPPPAALAVPWLYDAL